MDFIISNYATIIAVICIIIVCFFAIKDFVNLSSSKQIEKVKAWLLYAVILAEKELGSGTGDLKLRYVYDLFVSKFSWLAKIISFEQFSEWVDAALDEMKEKLQTNESISNYINKEQ